MPNGKLLVLTEAGEGIGNGHYSRCSAIKTYCEEMGVTTDIAVHVKGGNAFQYNAMLCDWVNSSSRINSQGYAYVLVDSYLCPLSFFDRLRAEFSTVLALDDYHRIDTGPDLIINPNIFGDRIPYRARAVGGDRFIILRRAFRTETRKNDIRPNVAKILITVGGSDFRNLIPVLTSLVVRQDMEKEVIIVAGNDQYCNALRERFLLDRIRFFGFVAEDTMRDLMLECDVAISACGQTLHELAWLGVPSIGICVGDDQVLNMKEYISRGFLNHEVSWNDPDLENKVTDQVNALRHAEERKRLARNGLATADNRGLENFYHEVFG